ncbi:MAG: signal peptidase I [Candidatus Komeilibacteria bacterium]|nr:signal peptidase I [Candidatus Komeilibacteria bacterium]
MNNILDLRDKKEEKTEVEPEQAVLEEVPEQPSPWQKFKEYFWEILKIVVISLIIIVPIRLYVIQPFIVEGDSMVPNFHNGEYLIVDEISYRFSEPVRGEVIIFHPPQDPKTYYIKRIIGLPGETVEFKNGKIYIYNTEFPQGQLLDEKLYLADSLANEEVKVTLKGKEYFVMGDNRNNSLDSRRLGPIAFDHIRGRAMLRAFPFNEFTVFKSPNYNF